MIYRVNLGINSSITVIRIMKLSRFCTTSDFTHYKYVMKFTYGLVFEQEQYD